MVSGLVSSRIINLVDFENNYHCIVCDLSRRRLPEQDLTAVSTSTRVSSWY